MYSLIPPCIMQLTFLGNTYTKTSDLRAAPSVELKYQGKTYRARQEEAAQQVAQSDIVLTYRGINYIK